ncbi:DUF4411 family protein [Paraperlucidibaca sp.]|uniref:DUF4411 family protein n=1 Tax=Paraperlucidibaca sp. TaxID=2708021 RepID=UPI0030F483C3
MKYLLDANTFIQAKNMYYSMTVCPGYWDWILQKNASSDISSTVSIYNELAKGDDELRDWAVKNKSIFMPDTDTNTQHKFSEIAIYLQAQSYKMKANALNEFLGGADPWLIAKAFTTNAIVVTQEKLNLDCRKKFLIPNVCKHFGVSYMNTFDLLSELKAEFVLRP